MAQKNKMARSKRAIFEEVAQAEKPALRPGGIETGPSKGRGAIRVWLAMLFVLVAGMVVIGGLTRLSDAGLSITEWAPVTGSVPPLNAADWQVEFDKYSATPQFELMNSAMELSEFKQIYWWEWGHRQLGRLVGLVWAVGFFFFLATKRIPNGWTGRLLLIGALGGLQGFVGWWMVSSGLGEGMVSVASYRLAVHLGLAFGILGLITWYYLRIGRREAELLNARRSGERRLVAGLTGLLHLSFLQILLGALTAGIDAGRAFPTWPKMGDGWLPPDPFMLEPLWRNFFEDAGLVQFVHRIGAYLVLALAIYVWMRGRRSAQDYTRSAVHVMLAFVVLQAALGIFTALYSAPLSLGILHQFGALLLWVQILRARYYARYPVQQTIKGAS